MPTIGTDCQIIIDGHGYWIEPASYKVARARVRRADLTGLAASSIGPGAGAGERFIDRGPGKREWTFIVVAFNAMIDYAANHQAITGQQIHDNLQTSYNKVNTQLGFTDLAGTAWTVWFDDMVEECSDARGQVDGLQYYLSVTLVEV